MNARSKGWLSWAGSAAAWLAEKLWGDQALDWLRPMLPPQLASLEKVLWLVWAYGLPVILFAAGAYWFWRAGLRRAAADPNNSGTWEWISINRCCFLFLDMAVPDDGKDRTWTSLPKDVLVMGKVIVGLANSRALRRRADPSGKTADTEPRAHGGSYLHRDDLKAMAAAIGFDPRFLR